MPNINKNIIMQAGAAVANATNKAAGLTATTPEPGTIISAIQLVNGGRVIGPAALAHFTESVRNKLLSLLVTMEPIQDFNGYSHPWPAGGGVNILEPLSGTNSIGLQFAAQSDGSIKVSGTATSNGGAFIAETFSLPYNGINVGDTLTLWSDHALMVRFLDSSSATISYVQARQTSTTVVVPDGTVSIRVFEAVSFTNVTAGTVVDETIRVYLAKANSFTSWSPYYNICPITGIDNLHVYVSPTTQQAQAKTYNVSFGTTVYAGFADLITGEVKERPQYQSYNGEVLVGPWLSSMDEYEAGVTPTTGAQVVDLGGTMTEYHITGQDIITLVGDNYIWSDSGDVTITE